MKPLTSTEQLILLALAPPADPNRHGGSPGDASESGYGVSIRRQIRERTGETLALTTVYGTLERLEHRGLVRSWWTEPTPDRGGRAKRCFALEAAGARALRDTRTLLDRMWLTARLDAGHS